LFLAMLAGAGMASLLASERLALTGRWSWLPLSLPALVIGLSALATLPWSYGDMTVPPPATIAGAAEFARLSGALGTTSAGEYFPVAVSQAPADVRSGFPENEARLDLETLPEGARLLAAQYRPLAYDLILDSPVAFTATFNTLFFEGWRGKIDGQPVDLRADGPTGLIGLDVPAGQHEITIRFQSTAARDLAGAISWISLLLMAPALFLVNRGRQPGKTAAPPAGQPAMILAVLVALLAVLFLRLVYFDRPGTLFLKTRFEGGQVIGADRVLNADFEQQMLLLAADVPDQLAADQELVIDLYWQTPAAVDQEYSSSVVVLDQHGLIVGQSDKQHPGVIPTARWATDEYARDRHRLQLTPGTPPGDYEIRVRVYQYGRPEERLNVLDQNGAPIGQALTIASLAVERPENAADVAEIVVDKKVEWPAGPGLVLAGHSDPGGSIRAGEPLLLEMYWQATDALPADELPADELPADELPADELPADEQLTIELVDSQGAVAQRFNAPLVDGLPTSTWRPGDLWRAVHLWHLPASTAAGDYDIVLHLGQERSLSLGAISVTTPDHQLAPTDIAFPAEIDFGNAGSNAVARLVGYDVAQTAAPGETLPVTLSWLALAETPVSYKVFVQLLDKEGRLVTGSDAVPAGWTRPTTGWIAGEYIQDRHELLLPADLPPGSYQLLVGLYDATTGQRLLTAGGEDAHLLLKNLDILAE